MQCSSLLFLGREGSLFKSSHQGAMSVLTTSSILCRWELLSLLSPWGVEGNPRDQRTGLEDAWQLARITQLCTYVKHRLFSTQGDCEVYRKTGTGKSWATHLMCRTRGQSVLVPWKSTEPRCGTQRDKLQGLALFELPPWKSGKLMLTYMWGWWICGYKCWKPNEKRSELLHLTN